MLSCVAVAERERDSGARKREGKREGGGGRHDAVTVRECASSVMHLSYYGVNFVPPLRIYATSTLCFLHLFPLTFSALHFACIFYLNQEKENVNKKLKHSTIVV